MIIPFKKLNYKTWNLIRETYQQNPLLHVYLMHAILYEKRFLLLLNTSDEKIYGYILVRYVKPVTAYIYGDINSPPRLIEKVPRIRCWNKIPLAFNGKIYYRMVVEEEKFRPYYPEKALRLTTKHVKQFIEFYSSRGVYMPYGKALQLLSTKKYYGVIVNNKIVSVGMAYIKLPEVWVIANVYTRPEYRGRGYAKIVTSAITRDGLNSGAFVELFVNENNEPAIRAYKKLGYKIEGFEIWYDKLTSTIGENPNTIK